MSPTQPSQSVRPAQVRACRWPEASPRLRLTVSAAFTAVVLAALALWPLQPAFAQHDHGAPAKSAAASSHGASRAEAIRPESRPAAGKSAEVDNRPGPGERAKPMSMDDLARKLSDKVSSVRDAQARTPTLKLVARAPSAERSGHGTPADKPGKQARSAHGKTAAAGLADAQEHAAHDVHWAYDGDGGPARWGELKPEFATCASGQRQSPIDIRGGLRVDLEPIKFDYRPVPFGVVDNGHTIQANVQPGNTIEVGGRRFELLQFHFHRPSEERINGRRYDMVIHLVHKSLEGKLAVVAVLVEQGRNHPVVQAVWNSLPLERNDELASPVPIDLNQLLPDDRRYYTYMGSLTTPPCSEGVLWMVIKQPTPLSPEQIALFARLYPMNARPIQQPSGRLIKESN
ncbi:MAG: carbonic anhydrase family protein [Burkholderiales bacterium]|nr:carbonic anhydrase family protein [Burkholderiales bacterium]